MSSSSSSDWRHCIHYLGPYEIDEELTATLTSQETPVVILFCSFHIKNFHVSSSSSDGQIFWFEGDSNSEHWDSIHDLRCFTHTLLIAKHSIRNMMTQISSWVRVPLDIRETMITQIASNLVQHQLNEGSNTVLGYTSIPCFQLDVRLAKIVDYDEEELNFHLAVQQSFDAAQQDEVVLQHHPGFAQLLESLESEIVGAILEDDKEECVICKDEFVTGVEVKRLPCSHRFHKQCITRWFHEKNTCPLCRHMMQV